MQSSVSSATPPPAPARPPRVTAPASTTSVSGSQRLHLAARLRSLSSTAPATAPEASVPPSKATATPYRPAAIPTRGGTQHIPANAFPAPGAPRLRAIRAPAAPSLLRIVRARSYLKCLAQGQQSAADA